MTSSDPSGNDIKLLLDEGMPARAAKLLTRDGIPTEHVYDLNLGGDPDEKIVAVALDRGLVIATLDADFHQWLAQHHAAAPSVIRVRVQRLNGPLMALLLAKVVKLVEDDLKRGAAVSVTEEKVRSHLLPLGERKDKT